MKLILILALVFTAFNTGLIWVIQLVHYPAFLHIDQEKYQAYQAIHMKSITWIVGPSMLLELLFTGLLLFSFQELPVRYLYLFGVVLLALIWVHTALWAAPTHSQLLDGFREEIIRKLINLNWWRTVAWSLKTIIFTYMLFKF